MRCFPIVNWRRTALAGCVSALLIPFTLVMPAGAATYEFDFGGPMGTFEAPLGGGLITAFNVTIGDTTFDLPAMDASQPVYNPILNTLNGTFDVEFTGAGAGVSTGAVFNSAPSASCLLGDLCVLELFDTANGTASPEWAFQNITQPTNIANGLYSINPIPLPPPIPLPAAFPLFAGGLGALGLLGWRRKQMAAA